MRYRRAGCRLVGCYTIRKWHSTSLSQLDSSGGYSGLHTACSRRQRDRRHGWSSSERQPDVVSSQSERPAVQPKPASGQRRTSFERMDVR